MQGIIQKEEEPYIDASLRTFVIMMSIERRDGVGHAQNKHISQITK